MRAWRRLPSRSADESGDTLVLSLLNVQEVLRSGCLFGAERLTERKVETAEAPERLVIAEQVADSRMLLP